MERFYKTFAKASDLLGHNGGTSAIFEVSWYGRSHRPVLKDTWQTYEFQSFINERNFDKMPFTIYFRIDVRTESTLLGELRHIID